MSKAMQSLPVTSPYCTGWHTCARSQATLSLVRGEKLPRQPHSQRAPRRHPALAPAAVAQARDKQSPPADLEGHVLIRLAAHSLAKVLKGALAAGSEHI